MRATKFARDAWPERTPGEVVERREITAAGAYAPASWEELDCPDEIELELAADDDRWQCVTDALRQAGLSADQVLIGYDGYPEWAPDEFVLTKQAEDCWYAGVPRGRRLVLRRI